MIPLWLTCISISCLQLLHSEPPSIIFCRTPTLALQWPLSKANGPLTCHLASLFSRDVDEFFACVNCRKWLVKASKASILKKIPATLPSRYAIETFLHSCQQTFEEHSDKIVKEICMYDRMEYAPRSCW